jgi:hypothetical protein
MVFGEPRTTKSDADADFFKHRARAVEVLPPRDASRPRRAGNEAFLENVEIDPAGLPVVIWEVDDDATADRGGSVAATGSLEASVFEEAFDAGGGFFGYLVGAEVGNLHATGVKLANWIPGGYLTSYDALVLISPADPAPTSTVRLSLWDGDPLAAFDTACSAGGVPAPIPGTTGTFSDLPRAVPASCLPGDGDVVVDQDPGGFDPASGCVGLYRLRVTLPAKTQVNCPRVWINMEQLDGCRMAWRIGDQDNGPDLGFMTTTELLYSNVFTPPLFCCGNPGMACTRATSAADCGHADACTDGTVDSAIAGQSDPGGMPPYYVAFNASIRAATDLRLYGQPVSADNPPEGAVTPGWSVSGGEIKLEKGDRPVWIDWKISAWDPDELADNPHRSKAMQGWVNPATFSSGLEGSVTYYRPACTTNAQCTTLVGPGTGSECRDSDEDMTVDECSPAMVKVARTDYIYRGLVQVGPAVDVSTDPRWVSAVNQASGLGATIWRCVGGIAPTNVCEPTFCPDPNAPCGDAGSPDGHCNGFPAAGIPDGFCRPDHTDRYEATTAMYVSADAKGTFQVGLFPSGVLTASYMIDDNNQFFPFLAVVPALITVETGQCCTTDLVCVTDEVTRNVCEDDLGGNFNPDATCADDCGCLSDAQCDDGNGCTTDVCDIGGTNQCINTPVSVPANSCCNPATGNIASFEDNNECTRDTCSEGGTVGVPVNDGAPHEGENCGDPLQCFFAQCTSGACVTADVNGQPCTTDEDCTGLDDTASTATCDVAAGECTCIACFTDLPCGDPLACYADVTFDVSGADDNCFGGGEKVTVSINVGQSLKLIGGGQFFIEYDPTCLDFQGITAVAPFTTVLAQEVNEAAGTIFWAVGVGLDPDTGEPEPCTLGGNSFGSISFAKVAGCDSCNLCYGGVNPRETLLAACGSQSQNESAICPLVECSKEIGSRDTVTVTVPENDKVNVDCDRRLATVTWSAPTVDSECGTGTLAYCHGNNGNVNLDSLCMHGGSLPVGVNNFCAGANVGCGDPDEACWTITVNEQTSLDVEVQLSPVIVAEAMSRCIDFQLYSDCVQPPLEFSQQLLFGGLFDHVGHFNDSIKIPDSGQWICITARDQQHTLRSCDFLDCVDGVYQAVFKSDPFFGGNWLVGGNLDAWKKDNPNAGHDVINILDFGQYISQYGKNYGGANTPCDKTTGNADINGDGVVDGLDFAFISLNFGEDSKDCCCPGSVAGNRVMLTEVSVLQLRQWGMGDLAVADLNQDGVVNTDDMSAFMAGTTPDDKGRDQGRKGSNLRSSRSR